MAEATALGHRDDVIDVYSNSWGPEDYGYVVSGPNTLAARTLAAGTQEVSNYLFERILESN